MGASISTREGGLATSAAGDRVDSWTLLRPLGKGGNAEVWQARDDADAIAAVKLLRVRNPESEPYRRFRDEVRVHQEMAGTAGVLPVLGHRLPERPSRRDPAWLAMPEATPIRKALEGADLRTTVKAVKSIASTLAGLAERGIFHRDVKPENLYQFRNEWSVGDFGLADFPDKESLTAAGGKLGPVGYIAPEMLTRPETAEAGPADVYSLAKTLWVLAAGQNFPVLGEQRQDTAGFRLFDMVDHPRTPQLDRLIERATAANPDARPSMADFSDELEAWLRVDDLVARPRPMNLADLAARVRATVGPEIRREELTRERIELAVAAVQRGIEHLRALMPQLSDVQGNPFGVTGDGQRLLRGLLVRGEVSSGAGVEKIWEGGGALTPTRGTRRTVVVPAVGAELFDDGSLDFACGWILLQDDRLADVVWAEAATSAVGSSAEEAGIQVLLRALDEHLPAAIEATLD